MKGQIDLHMHTNCSDGLLKPSELLEVVRSSGVKAFSVTDHDTLEGYRAIKDLLKPGDPELVVGTELSVDCHGDDLHLLAYLFNPDSVAFNHALAHFQEERNRRAERMVDRLQEMGLDLKYEQVLEVAGDSAVGRPHIAEAMVRQGQVSGFEAAFKKYIGNKGPAYIAKAKLKPKEAIDLVHDAGGVAIVAHPGINGMFEHVEELASLNLDGLEVYHYSHSQSQVKQFRKLAKRLNLLQSGGSDFHGRHEREGEIGSEPVPVEFLDDLKQRANEIRGNA